MSEPDYPDDPQNPLHQRLFVIRPANSFFETTGLSRHHLASRVVGILTPHLPFETFYEGWRFSWQRKAKADFIAEFVDLWSEATANYCLEPGEPEVPPSFLTHLRESPSAETAFDRWWTLEEVLEVMEIDAQWRPSQTIE